MGALCDRCTEEIRERDNGVMMPGIAGIGAIYHRECFRRMVLGSIAHIEERCSCYVPGSRESDPPELSKREAARLVDRWAEESAVSGEAPCKVN